MLIEQRRGLLGELRAQRRALLHQPAHGIRIGDVGGLHLLAGAHLIAQLPRARFEIRLLAARRRDLRIDLGELLIRQRAIVGADEQIGLDAIFFDLGLRLLDLLTHLVDLDGEPIAGGAGLVLLGRLLHGEIIFGHRIGDAGGNLRIGRTEVDGDHARLLDRKHVEPVVIGFERALVLRHRTGIATDADQPEQRPEQRCAAHRGIEFWIGGEVFFFDHLTREIARQHDLDLTGHRFGIDRGKRPAALVGLGAHEHVLAHLQQQARLGAIARRDHIDDQVGGGRRQQRDAQDHRFLAPQRAAEAAHIGLAGHDHRRNDRNWRVGCFRLLREHHHYSKRTTLRRRSDLKLLWLLPR